MKSAREISKELGMELWKYYQGKECKVEAGEPDEYLQQAIEQRDRELVEEVCEVVHWAGRNTDKSPSIHREDIKREIRQRFLPKKDGEDE